LQGAGRGYLRLANTPFEKEHSIRSAFFLSYGGEEAGFDHCAEGRKGSHTPPEDLQACLQGAGRGYLRSANTPFEKEHSIRSAFFYLMAARGQDSCHLCALPFFSKIILLFLH